MIKRGSARTSFVHGVISAQVQKSATAVSYHKGDRSFNRVGASDDYQPDSTFMITDSVYLNPTMFGSIVDMLTWMTAYLASSSIWAFSYLCQLTRAGYRTLSATSSYRNLFDAGFIVLGDEAISMDRCGWCLE